MCHPSLGLKNCKYCLSLNPCSYFCTYYELLNKLLFTSIFTVVTKKKKMYIKERNWKIKYINLLRFGWSSVSERISFVHHGAHVFAAVSSGELCVVGYLPGLIGSLISEMTVCIAVNGMEVTGALQERTRSVDRNTNGSSDPIRLPGPPDPQDFLQVSWEAVCGWYCTDLCDRESHTSRPKHSPCSRVEKVVPKAAIRELPMWSHSFSY